MNPEYEQFLLNLGFFNIKLGLDTIGEMLRRLGNPHHHPRIIHIAGTNGKGSTLATLEQLLLDSGFSTGSTISPHLISYNERFRISGQPVSDDRLNAAFEKVCQACDISLDLKNATSSDGTISPTFFEFSIAIAFELFRDSKVDYILLETGMGGRLDATNIVENPLACIITKIAFDHQQYLGDTIEAIASEKLGILKRDALVFIAKQDETIHPLIREFCCDLNLDPYICPRDFGYRFMGDFGITYYTSANSGTSTPDMRQSTDIIKTQSLVGHHQYQNTATALAVYKTIIPLDQQMDNAGIDRSLGSVKWPARLEFIDSKGRVLIDAAHNPSGIESLLNYLVSEYKDKRILFAIGWKNDKNLSGQLGIEGIDSLEFIPIDSALEAATKAEDVYSQLEGRGFRIHHPITTRDLVNRIKDSSLPAHDLLVVAGSIYLLGEFLSDWEESNTSTQ